MTVIIVGAGIGGLALARTMSMNGNDDYVLLEQAEAITAVGAGIQMTPNATRVFDYLGLGDELIREAVECEGTVYHDIASDEFLFSTPAGKSVRDRYGFGYYQIHRAWLLDVLRRSVDLDRVRLDSRCVSVRQEGGRVFAELANGEIIEGDALIGADGVNSVVRKTVLPSAGPAEFSGVIGCRAVIPADRVKHLNMDNRQHTWWGPNLRVVAYWVEGGAGLNFLAMVPCESDDRAVWSEVASPASLRKMFDGSCGMITDMIDVIDDTFATGVFGHSPFSHIVDGRIALLGDAAHPLPPYLANGGAQALEDAVVLGYCLSHNDDVEAALVDYEARRLSRATHVQLGAWEMDDLGRVSDPAKRLKRNDTLKGKMASDPNGGWLRDWLWGYDVVGAATSPAVTVPPERPVLEFG